MYCATHDTCCVSSHDLQQHAARPAQQHHVHTLSVASKAASYCCRRRVGAAALACALPRQRPKYGGNDRLTLCMFSHIAWLNVCCAAMEPRCHCSQCPQVSVTPVCAPSFAADRAHPTVPASHPAPTAGAGAAADTHHHHDVTKEWCHGDSSPPSVNDLHLP